MSEAGEEGVLDHADSFFTFLYAFFTRPTGIAVFVLAILLIVFLNFILNTIDAVRNIFMWFYDIRGGNIVLLAMGIMLMTCGWDGSKVLISTWFEQSGIVWMLNELRTRTWLTTETVVFSGGME